MVLSCPVWASCDLVYTSWSNLIIFLMHSNWMSTRNKVSCQSSKRCSFHLWLSVTQMFPFHCFLREQRTWRTRSASSRCHLMSEVRNHTEAGLTLRQRKSQGTAQGHGGIWARGWFQPALPVRSHSLLGKSRAIRAVGDTIIVRTREGNAQKAPSVVTGISHRM